MLTRTLLAAAPSTVTVGYSSADATAAVGTICTLSRERPAVQVISTKMVYLPSSTSRTLPVHEQAVPSVRVPLTVTGLPLTNGAPKARRGSQDLLVMTAFSSRRLLKSRVVGMGDSGRGCGDHSAYRSTLTS